MSRTYVMGLDGSLYRDIGIVAVPGNSSGWAEVTGVQDLTLSVTADTSDATSRASNGWRQVVATLRSGSVDFSILWEPDNTMIRTLWDDFISGCSHPYLITDGPPAVECATSTVLIWRFHAWFVITGFDWNQSLTDPMTADISMEIGPGTASTPVFSEDAEW